MKFDVVSKLGLQAKGDSDDGGGMGDATTSVELEQAYKKFCDAAATETNRTANRYHFDASRVLLMLGRAKEATARLQAAVGIDPTHHLTRLLLAVATLQAGTAAKFDAIGLALDELLYTLGLRTMARLLPPRVVKKAGAAAAAAAEGADAAAPPPPPDTLDWPHVVNVRCFKVVGDALLANRRFEDAVRVFRDGVGLLPQLLYNMQNKESGLYIELEVALISAHHGLIKALWGAGDKAEAALYSNRTAKLFDSLVFKDHPRVVPLAGAFLRTTVQICPAQAELCSRLGAHMLRQFDRASEDPKALDDAFAW